MSSKLKRTYAQYFSSSPSIQDQPKHDSNPTQDHLKVLEDMIYDVNVDLNELYPKIKEWRNYYQSKFDKTTELLERINVLWDWDEAKKSGLPLVIHEDDVNMTERMIEPPLKSVVLSLGFSLHYDKNNGIRFTIDQDEYDRIDTLSGLLRETFDESCCFDFFHVKDQKFVDAQCRKHNIMKPQVENYSIKGSFKARYLVYNPYNEQTTPNPSPDE